MQRSAIMPDSLLTLQELSRRTAMTPAVLEQRMVGGTFPLPLLRGTQRVWVESEVLAVIDHDIATLPRLQTLEARTSAALSDKPQASNNTVPAPIPFEERAIGAREAGQILGYTARSMLQLVAVLAGFPPRLTRKPATWRAGDILRWRDEYLSNHRKRRRRTP